MDVEEWKAKLLGLITSGKASPALREWVAQCALSASELGDIDEDVFDEIENAT